MLKSASLAIIQAWKTQELPHLQKNLRHQKPAEIRCHSLDLGYSEEHPEERTRRLKIYQSLLRICEILMGQEY